MAGFLATMLATGASQRPPPETSDYWYEPFSPTTASGIRVSVKNALTVPAVRRAWTVLAGAIASLPLHLHRKTERGSEVARDHPVDELIHRRPSAGMSAFKFWHSMAGSLIFYNHAYAEIRPSRRGAIGGLEFQPPENVARVKLSNGRMAYDFSDPDTGRVRRLLPEEVFHIQGPSIGGIDESVIEHGRDTVANAIALTRYIGRQWKNGARLSGVLEHPGTVSGEEGAQRLRSDWKRIFSGIDNAGATAVLEEGMKFREISQKNVDAQLLESWTMSVQEIGRLFGVPSVLLGHADKTSTYASAEQFLISFVVHSLGHWLKCIEAEINAQLVLRPREYYAEFAVQGLLRGDQPARSDFYQKGIQSGWLSPNEVRALENLPEREGGDVLFRPLNVEPVGGPARPAVPAGYMQHSSGLLVRA